MGVVLLVTDQRLELLAAIARHCWRGVHWERKPGKPPGCVKEPLKFEHLKRHLTPAGPYIGLAPIVPGESTTRIALLDMDSHKGEVDWDSMLQLAQRAAHDSRAFGLEPVVFRSSGGQGIHVMFLWDEPQDAYSVRELMRQLLKRLDLRSGTKGVKHGEVEIFPKQDRVELGEYGSMFILPFAGKSEVLW